ncbi:MAG TPA: hypothetical protein VGB38_07695 [bacterium]
MVKKTIVFMLISAVSLLMSITASASSQTLEGSWQGTLNAGGAKLRIVFKIVRLEDGRWKTTLDSPDQGAKDIPVDETPPYAATACC